MEVESGVHKSDLLEECTPPHVMARERYLHLHYGIIRPQKKGCYCIPRVDMIPMAVITGFRPPLYIIIPIQ